MAFDIPHIVVVEKTSQGSANGGPNFPFTLVAIDKDGSRIGGIGVQLGDLSAALTVARSRNAVEGDITVAAGLKNISAPLEQQHQWYLSESLPVGW